MSRITRNIIYNGLGQGLSVILGFVAVRFVFRLLGGDALGLIYFSLAFSAALTVALRLGICESAVREVASHQAERPEYIKSFIRTSSLLYWTGYLTLAGVAYVAAPYLIHHWVKLSSLDALTATKILRILSIGALAALPGGLYRAVLVGLQHMGITNLVDVGGKALQQVGIFVILLMHGSLFQVAYWIAGCMGLSVVITWAACARSFSARALLSFGFSMDVVRQNVSYASALMTITLTSWALGQADRIIVSKLLPLKVLGLFSFAAGAVAQGTLLTAAINNAILPHFSRQYAGGNFTEMKASYNKIHDLICFATIPIFAGGPFIAIPFLTHVFDAPSARMLLLPVTFLCISYYMNGTLTAPYVVSLAMGRPDISARQNVYALFFGIPASILAIYFFGLKGAGFSWVLIHIFLYSYGLPRICRECLGIAPREWYFHILRILAPAALIYGTAWVILRALGAFTALWLGVAYVGASAAYVIAAYVMMGEELRGRLWRSFQVMLPKIVQAS
jgi:O-antigen/teichoic acid export membrane protein